MSVEPFLYAVAMMVSIYALLLAIQPKLALQLVRGEIGIEAFAQLASEKERNIYLKNVVMRLEGEKKTKLIIEVDLEEEFGPSSSGKSITVAGTEGAVPVPEHEEIKINLNIYKAARR